jgi:predicted  nucleic acid-binding Zn ribbon protein
MGALFGVEQILLSQRNSGLEMNDDAQTQPPAARCPYCRDTMKLVRHLTLQALPDIYIYYCEACRHVENIKQERAA